MTPKPTDLPKGIEALASGWRQSWAQPMPGDTSLFFNRAGLDQNFEDKVDLPVRVPRLAVQLGRRGP